MSLLSRPSGEPARLLRPPCLTIRAATKLASRRRKPMANADRRYTYRLDLPEDRVRVFAPSAGRVVVADLSASGSGLIVNPSDLEGMTAEPATFQFAGGRSFSVR